MRLSATGIPRNLDAPVVGRVRRDTRDAVPSSDEILVTDREPAELPSGFAGYVTTSRGDASSAMLTECETTDHLVDGHIVSLSGAGRGLVRTLYRPESSHNFLFITDRCNSYCLMCSQPPRDHDDVAFFGHVNREVVRLIAEPPHAIGITGGEPTIAGDLLVDLIRRIDERFPETHIHMLSNGRAFAWRSIAAKYGRLRAKHLTIAVPLYSDDPTQHDHVVQARHAFEQTVGGLMNLARWGIEVEIRVVVHALTIARLPELAEFVYRTFPFAAHVALMGLEPTGFAKANWTQLWIDPAEPTYRDHLERAATLLFHRGMNVSIYNHQLCVLPRTLWPLAARSISDWKNIFLPACDGCVERDRCGGLFASAERRHSAHLKSIVPP